MCEKIFLRPKRSTCATVMPQFGLNVRAAEQVNQLESVIASMEEDSLTQHQVIRFRMRSAGWLRFLHLQEPGRVAHHHC